MMADAHGCVFGDINGCRKEGRCLQPSNYKLKCPARGTVRRSDYVVPEGRLSKLITKADIALEALTKNGGILDPQEAKNFGMPFEIKALKEALFKASWERMVLLAAMQPVAEPTNAFEWDDLDNACRAYRALR